MLLEAWLFVGLIALLATGVAGYLAAANTAEDDGVVIIAGTLGFVAWGIWTFGTLNVEVVGDSVVYNFEMPAVTLLGVALALVPGYIALTGPIEIISRTRDTRMEDV